MGLAGAVVFVHSSAPSLDADVAPVVATAVSVGAYGVVLAAALRLFVWPSWLGSFHVPRTSAVLAYVLYVVGELALIRLGTLWLADVRHPDARPALIAGVVGLHFIPFAWAFGERMFLWLGAPLLLLGTLGLGAEVWGDVRAAPWVAVASGWVMAVILLVYASGVFARPSVGPDASSRSAAPAS